MSEITTTQQMVPPRYLSSAVHALLSRYDGHLAAMWVTLYAEPLDQSVVNQLFTVNRFWRDQLAQLAAPTFNERECLIDAVAVGDWLRLFEKHVLPTIVAHRLPIQRQIVAPIDGLPVWSDILNWSPDYAR